MTERRMDDQRLTRRALLRALTGVAATAALAACGGTPTATSAPSAAPTMAPTAAAAAAATRAATTAAAAATTAPSVAPTAATAAATPATAAAATTTRAASPVASATRSGSPAAAPPPAQLVAVAATTTQLQDFVKNVGGNRITLSGILKPNVDPHDYETTVQDAQTIGRAQMICVYGVGLDAWIEKAIANANAKAPVVTVTAGIMPLKGSDKEPSGDPHMWFDPTLVQQMVTTIGEALAKVEPAGAAVYRQNAQAYNAQIARMDAQVRGIYNQIPVADRKLVTNHDAFQYLAKHFNLTIVGAVIPSISDAAEPTAQNINDLIDTIRAEKVKAIFAESSANPRVAQQVAQETGIKIVDNLYGDTLGEPGSDGDTYLKMMVADATLITSALK